MAAGGKERFIIRPEKIRFVDILTLLFLRRPISSYAFVDIAGDQTALELGFGPFNWITRLTVVIIKFLHSIKVPLRWAGIVAEFLCNFFALNGGILGLLWNLIRFKVVWPKRAAANFRSIIAFIDQRTELKESSKLLELFPTLGNFMDTKPIVQYYNGKGKDACKADRLGTVSFLELTTMAAKIVYENAAYIENVVNNVWKMNFVGFYSCWDKFQEADTTQAFIFTNAPTDANLIVLAFRGTEPFNAEDWATDVNLSYMSMGKLGKLHVGFLKALGLQDDQRGTDGFPKEQPNVQQPIAYYTLRAQLKKLRSQHPNAQIIVTGHSLGGALAAVFPGLLSMHDESDILEKLYGVYTYGQPRVGDSTYAEYLRTYVKCQYVRMVYRFDIVPRIPFDLPPFSIYRHGGQCMYYDGWYKGKIMEADVPNPNYFNPTYVPTMYLNAVGDLFRGLFMRWSKGKEWKEGPVSIMWRASGLVLPGIASHSPRDYVNANRLYKLVAKEV